MTRTHCAPARPVVRPRLESMEGRSLPSIWSPPVNLGPVVNTQQLDQRCTISKDGLSLFFGSNRPGSVGTIEGSDLYVTQRASLNDPWGTPQKVEALSSNWDDNAPTFSPDGHWVYFGSDREHGSGGYDIWAAHRQDKDDDFGWETPVNLGPVVNSSVHDDGPTYFEDENGEVSLYFTSLRDGGQGDYDIYVSHATADDHLSFGPATNVAELNSLRRDTRTSISRDGLEFFLTSTRVGSVPDALGAPSLDIWVATRASTADPWGTPVNLGAPVNTPANDGAPSLSFDGLTLYFDSTRSGSGGQGMRDLYVTTRSKLNEIGGERASAALPRPHHPARGQHGPLGHHAARPRRVSLLAAPVGVRAPVRPAERVPAVMTSAGADTVASRYTPTANVAPVPAALSLTAPAKADTHLPGFDLSAGTDPVTV
jgi:WD40-like Beta Propeller Repeat